jgi:hypothetical protein
MMPKTLFFVGAPESKALNWEEELFDTFSEPFNRYIQASTPTVDVLQSVRSTSPSQHGLPQWRSLALEREHLTTGISQNHAWQPEFQGASFFTTSDMGSFIEEITQGSSFEFQQSSVDSVDQILSQFYEESYARHAEIPSSQLRVASDSGGSFPSQANTTSFNSEDAYEESQSMPPGEAPKSGPLNNLVEIPNARYLKSIHPQVMTVNLVVGIISVPTARLIRTKRGANVELIEALVGDETKAGFGINFWLSSSQAAEAGLKESVESLRPQDVILIRNVALSSFRDKVYGQSLRKGMTKVHLLHRRRIDRKDIGGCYSTADLRRASASNPQLLKAKTVREWVLQFVGGRVGHSTRQQASCPPESLPPDTQ